MTPVLLSLDSVGVDGTAIVTYTHLPLVLLFAFSISLRCIGFWRLGRTDGGAGENGSILLFLCTCFEGPGGSMCLYGGKKGRQSYGLSVERIVTMKDMAFPRSREGRSFGLSVCLLWFQVPSCACCRNSSREEDGRSRVRFVFLLLELGRDVQMRPPACLLAGIDMVQNRTQSVV